jgi:8-amino-7-oxononanoate synthase
MSAPVDFTSALYLGLHHPQQAVGGWRAMTLGKPAALADVPGARDVARELAALQGCAAATLLPSTLHLFWDLFGMLARERYALLVDEAAYPVARWGAERAAALGVPMRTFRSAELERLAAGTAAIGCRPLILADGYRPGAAQPPPLARYAAVARRQGGLLVLDDTQALGILGPHGSGSIRLHGLTGAPVLVGASLAKGFGVPLAVLAGDAAAIDRFEALAETRLHASPPAVPTVLAAAHALRVNRQWGDALRAVLAQRIAQFRAALAERGLAADGGTFPVQALRLPAGTDLAAAHARLRRDGVLALPQYRDGTARLVFLIRADHAPAQIARAARVVAHHLEELA